MLQNTILQESESNHAKQQKGGLSNAKFRTKKKKKCWAADGNKATRCLLCLPFFISQSVAQTLPCFKDFQVKKSAYVKSSFGCKFQQSIAAITLSNVICGVVYKMRNKIIMEC